MFFFILGLIFLFAGILSVPVLKIYNKNSGNEAPTSPVFWAGLIPAGVFIFISCSTIVPTRNVGVATSFGKPVATYEHGWHLKAPWWKVSDMDGTIQNSVYNGDNQIDVRLANNAKASVDVSIQWELKTEGAEEIYMNYKDANLEVVQSNIIDRNLRQVLNDNMNSYDPLNPEVINSDADSPTSLSGIAEAVETEMKKLVGEQVEIHSVTIPVINFDPATQQRIDSYQAEVAKTRNAEQAKKTAEQEAEANRILNESISDNLNVSKCLDIARETNQNMICFPSNVTPVKTVE